MGRCCLALVAAIALFTCLAGTSRAGESQIFASAATGTPDVKTIDCLAFGPRGLLLIGDGRGQQIWAIQLPAEEASPGALKKPLEDIAAKLAAPLGTKAENLAILDLAVRPDTGTAYVAVRKQDDKSHAILTVGGAGAIGLVSLEDVRHARLALPGGDIRVSLVTDVAWAEDRVIAGARANDAFASKIFVAKAPLEHDAPGKTYSAETYHVSHRRWETKAPMSVILPYKQDGKSYVVGAFSCTPVVKYPLDDVAPEAQVKGESVLELGSGNRPLDMITYTKDGKQYVLVNTFRFHHERKPFGPSPYWTCRFEGDFLAARDAINEEAVHRFDRDPSVAERVQQIDAFNGVTQMDRLGDDQALVLRESENKRLDLEPMPLP